MKHVEISLYQHLHSPLALQSIQNLNSAMPLICCDARASRPTASPLTGVSRQPIQKPSVPRNPSEHTLALQPVVPLHGKKAPSPPRRSPCFRQSALPKLTRTRAQKMHGESGSESPRRPPSPGRSPPLPDGSGLMSTSRPLRMISWLFSRVCARPVPSHTHRVHFRGGRDPAPGECCDNCWKYPWQPFP